MDSQLADVTHVLYTLPADQSPPCGTLMEALSRGKGKPDSIMVQDVNSLVREGIEMPDWLWGVPTLIDVKTRTPYRGRQIFDLFYAQKLIPLADPEVGSGGGDDAAARGGGGGPPSPLDSRETSSRESRKVTAEDVEMYMKRNKIEPASTSAPQEGEAVV